VRGEWTDATDYAVEDVVSGGGGLWVATADSNGIDPTIPAAITFVGKGGADGATNGGGATPNASSLSSFTISVDTAISAVKIHPLTTNVETWRVGICDDTSGPTHPNWLGFQDVSVLGDQDYVVATFDAVDLVAGTTYGVVAAPVTGTADVFNYACSTSGPGIETGIVDNSKRGAATLGGWTSTTMSATSRSGRPLASGGRSSQSAPAPVERLARSAQLDPSVPQAPSAPRVLSA
jgi:hypothetical protein